jgi:Protein of unknown function (DUF3341)
VITLRRHSVVAEFASADALLEAVRQVRAAGHERMETYSPYEVPGLDDALPRPPSRLPKLVFAGGALAALGAYGVQVYANVIRYPQNAGGRPTHAAAPFVISTFEGLVLGAALFAFFGFLVLLGLPRLYRPIFNVDGFDRASRDRFFLAVERPRLAPGRALDELLESLGAVDVRPMKGKP